VRKFWVSALQLFDSLSVLTGDAIPLHGHSGFDPLVHYVHWSSRLGLPEEEFQIFLHSLAAFLRWQGIGYLFLSPF
jgi:hypothetical protein